MRMLPWWMGLIIFVFGTLFGFIMAALLFANDEGDDNQ